MRAAPALRLLIGPLELLHEQAGPGLLRLTRLGVTVLWIVKLLLDPLWRLAHLPYELIQPVGLLRLFPTAGLESLFSFPGLILLWILTLLSLIACLSIRGFLFASPVAAFLLTLYSSAIRSFGPAVHTDIVLLFAMYVLAAFAWADRLSPPPPGAANVPNRRAAYPLITIVALLCLCYCLVGCTRALLGGPRVFTGDTMEYWAVDAGLRGYYFNLGVGWQIPQWPLIVTLLRLGLPVITLFEITAPLCLVSSHYRWIFIPTMFSFHLLSLVVMNIFFFDDMLLYLLLIDWSRRFSSLRAR